jgi:hypothetical protein
MKNCQAFQIVLSTTLEVLKILSIISASATHHPRPTHTAGATAGPNPTWPYQKHVPTSKWYCGTESERLIGLRSISNLCTYFFVLLTTPSLLDMVQRMIPLRGARSSLLSDR